MANLNNLRRGPVVALASATSANGTARNGATIDLGNVAVGTLALFVQTTIVTGSVVATWKFQVSNDNTNFYDLALLNNPANVTITATEAGRVLAVPSNAHAWKYGRVVATLSGAATAAGDLTKSDYYHLDVKLSYR